MSLLSIPANFPASSVPRKITCRRILFFLKGRSILPNHFKHAFLYYVQMYFLVDQPVLQIGMNVEI